MNEMSEGHRSWMIAKLKEYPSELRGKAQQDLEQMYKFGVLRGYGQAGKEIAEPLMDLFDRTSISGKK